MYTRTFTFFGVGSTIFVKLPSDRQTTDTLQTYENMISLWCIVAHVWYALIYVWAPQIVSCLYRLFLWLVTMAPAYDGDTNDDSYAGLGMYTIG